MPKFSVVVPVYKVEEYLRECVDSILNQNYTDFEVILVDDGSPDNCPQMCDEYALKDSRIKVIHQQNGGLSCARNSGMAVASGDYIWFVDSDDFLCENALKLVKEHFDEDAQIINFGIISNLYSGETEKTELEYTGSADKKKLCELMKSACSNHLFTFVWRSVYKLSFLRENSLHFIEGLSFAEDSAFNSEAFLKADKICFANIFPYVYRQRQDGISKGVDKKFDVNIINHFNLYDKIRDENYEKYCIEKSDEYYEDAGRFILLNTFMCALVRRIYMSGNKNKFFCFKKAAKSDMVRKACGRFDINKIKSKSLDWYVLWAVKHRIYIIGHLICKYVLYK